jgi:hypothetical protein
VPCVGVSMGVERIFTIMENRAKERGDKVCRPVASSLFVSPALPRAVLLRDRKRGTALHHTLTHMHAPHRTLHACMLLTTHTHTHARTHTHTHTHPLLHTFALAYSLHNSHTCILSIACIVGTVLTHARTHCVHRCDSTRRKSSLHRARRTSSSSACDSSPSCGLEGFAPSRLRRPTRSFSSAFSTPRAPESRMSSSSEQTRSSEALSRCLFFLLLFVFALLKLVGVRGQYPPLSLYESMVNILLYLCMRAWF